MRLWARMTNPLYYVVHLIIFPIAAVVFGIFLRNCGLEVAANGWVLSPRFVWHSSLCVSSALFCLLQLDPSSMLGIIPAPWRNFLGHLLTCLLLNALCSTLYMYIIVLAVRYLPTAQVPPLFTKLWIAASVLSTLLAFCMALTGAIMDRSNWFGIAVIVTLLQEMVILVFTHTGLHKLGSLLKELELQTKTSYVTQRRKLWIIRIVLTVLILCHEGNIFGPGSVIYTIANPEPAHRFDPEVFDLIYPVQDVLLALAHLTLVYVSNRPTNSPAAHTTVVVLGDRSAASRTTSAV